MNHWTGDVAAEISCNYMTESIPCTKKFQISFESKLKHHNIVVLSSFERSLRTMAGKSEGKKAEKGELRDLLTHELLWDQYTIVSLKDKCLRPKEKGIDAHFVQREVQQHCMVYGPSPKPSCRLCVADMAGS